MPPKDQPDWLARTQFQTQAYDWVALSDPGPGVRAVATVSRGAAVRPILAAVMATLFQGAAGSSALRVNVWNGGETGAIFWSVILATSANGGVDRWVQSDLALRNTDTVGLSGVMTVSFELAPPAGFNQVISIGGWDS